MMKIRNDRRRMWLAGLVMVCVMLLVGAALGAMSIHDMQPLKTSDSTPAKAVMFPLEVYRAEQMVDMWNAAAAMRAGEQAKLWRVPTVEESLVYAKTGEAWFWKPVQTDLTEAVGRLPQQSREAIRFDFRLDEKRPGVLMLSVPTEELREAMQQFVDNTALAMGMKIPRPQDRGKETDINLSSAAKQIAAESGLAKMNWKNYLMIAVCFGLFYLAIVKGFEPLLLIPIAAGGFLANAAGAGMVAPPSAGEAGGVLYYFFTYGIESGIFPLLIFLGIGALTDFGPMLANPWSALMGGGAQFAIFGSFVLAILFGFDLKESGAIAIIGGADGPTSIYVATRLSPDLLGAVAVAAYSYMALVPLIQPPVMKLLTTAEEKRIVMQQLKPVSRAAKVLFPIVTTFLCVLILPSAVPLIGMLMLGNFLRESQVTDRLVKAAQNEIINIVTIALGLAVGTKLAADKFLDPKTLLIIVLGCTAFLLGTAGGVLIAKLMNKLSGGKINPLIGSAGVSAVPMAARVSHNVGVQYNRSNMLLMHAMGPNVSGVIGSAVAAGILLAILK